MTTKELYSSTEVARILNVSRTSVFQQIKFGKIKATKVGRNFVISHAAVLEALGKNIGKSKKEELERAIDMAMKHFGETFRMLSKE